MHLYHLILTTVLWNWHPNYSSFTIKGRTLKAKCWSTRKSRDRIWSQGGAWAEVLFWSWEVWRDTFSFHCSSPNSHYLGSLTIVLWPSTIASSVPFSKDCSFKWSVTSQNCPVSSFHRSQMLVLSFQHFTAVTCSTGCVLLANHPGMEGNVGWCWNQSCKP